MCMPCERNEILVNEFSCDPCDLGYWPNQNKTGKLIIFKYIYDNCFI